MTFFKKVTDRTPGKYPWPWKRTYGGFRRWVWLLFCKRVILVVDHMYISKAAAYAMDLESMRLTGLILFVCDTPTPVQVFDIDRLTEKEFRELEVLIKEANARYESTVLVRNEGGV